MEARARGALLSLLGFIIFRCVRAGENSTVGYETSGVNCTDHIDLEEWRGHFTRCPEEYKYYCFKGKCRYVKSRNTPSCLCEEGYTGSRCEWLDLFYLQSDRGQVVVISLIVAMIVLIILIIIICVFYYHCRQRRKSRKEEEMETLERAPTLKAEETLETYLA